ncbi:MAG TPA: porin family protein [Hanamia sp.]|jgi:Outer membrane protein beta-barrel domain|nr:porin family protein [Hanamia sp.]
MKTKLFSLAILCFISSSIFAQSFSVGIKGGANLGKISGQSFKDQFTLGYHVGAFATIPLGTKWAIQPEAMLSQVNVDTASDFSQVYQFNHVDKIKLQYLSIPILLNYNINKFITLQAGPQFGIMLDKNKDLLQNGKDAFKTQNFAMAAGLQLNLLKFRVYGRFVGGLTDISNIGSADTWKTQSIQLGVGIALF